MGIPKFYRWLSERYPLINQPGGATVAPIIDNFYLDMNGIVHNCKITGDPSGPKTEEEMILQIFTYLEKLVSLIQPQKILFMAIDGVAPRAKMNQQRARRFKTAIEQREAAKKAEKKSTAADENERKAEPFDSNCITPGTAFMMRLGEHLRFFIRKKVSEDPVWQRPTIIFSGEWSVHAGHEVPGEGEHKIMEHIRWTRVSEAAAGGNSGTSSSVPTRHCMYGLDADLIMLALVTHQPNFCLLREVVHYTAGGMGQPARKALANPAAEHFVLLQIGLLRQYLALEFGGIEGLPFELDMERVVDDFVLFCMLVGNDFLPPLPTVDISEGSLETMLELYKEMLPLLGGYLTYAGKLHRGRLEKFLRRLATLEATTLQKRALDTEEMEAKRARGRGGKGGKGADTPTWYSERVVEKKERIEKAQAAVAATGGAYAALADVGEENAELTAEPVPRDDLELLAAALEEPENDDAALAGGIPGPHNDTTAGNQGTTSKAPGAGAAAAGGPSNRQTGAGPTMMSKEARALFLAGDADAALVAWKDRYYGVKLGLGADLAARRRVTEAYIQGLHWVLEYYYRGVVSWNWYYPFHYAPMASELKFFLDKASPIADFYPTSFEVDLEGKRAEWEGVVLIPFIDEQRLLRAARSIPAAALTEQERACNAHGPVTIFRHTRGGTKETKFCSSTLPGRYGNIIYCNSIAVDKPPPPPLPDGKLGFVPEVSKEGKAVPPSFPTLNHVNTTASIRNIACTVFGLASRRPSLVLEAPFAASTEEPEGGWKARAQALSAVLIGKRVWIRWPYLVEGIVTAICCDAGRIGPDKQVKPPSPLFEEETTTLTSDYLLKKGIDIGEVPLWLEVRPLELLLRRLDGSVEKRYSQTAELVPPQLLLRTNASPDPRFDVGRLSAGAARLDPGTRGVMLVGPYYGCLATVLEAEEGLVVGAAAPAGPKGAAVQGPGTTTAAPAGPKGPPTAAAAAAKPLRIQVQPPPPDAATVASTARSLLRGVEERYVSSRDVATRLDVSPGTLGRLTGTLWLRLGQSRSDGRLDAGLSVRMPGSGLAVPDAARFVPDEQGPAGNGGSTMASGGAGKSPAAAAPASAQKPGGLGGGRWEYSEALVQTLREYKRRARWLWAAVEADGSKIELDATAIAPGATPDERRAAAEDLVAWLRRQPLARRPLVPALSRAAPESAIKAFQAAALTGPGSSASRPNEDTSSAVTLSGVAPALMALPCQRGQAVYATAGGEFVPGDRVVALGGTGVPPFGARGTVTGTFGADAVEVVFDMAFPGGTDLGGRCMGNAGAYCNPRELLHLARGVNKGQSGGVAQPVAKQSAAGAARGPGATRAPVGVSSMPAATAVSAKFAHQTTAPVATAPPPPPRIVDERAEARAAAATVGDVANNVVPLPAKKAWQQRMPVAPTDPSDRGFAMGRGKPAGHPTAKATQAPAGAKSPAAPGSMGPAPGGHVTAVSPSVASDPAIIAAPRPVVAAVATPAASPAVPLPPPPPRNHQSDGGGGGDPLAALFAKLNTQSGPGPRTAPVSPAVTTPHPIPPPPPPRALPSDPAILHLGRGRQPSPVVAPVAPGVASPLLAMLHRSASAQSQGSGTGVGAPLVPPEMRRPVSSSELERSLLHQAAPAPGPITGGTTASGTPAVPRAPEPAIPNRIAGTAPDPHSFWTMLQQQGGK